MMRRRTFLRLLGVGGTAALLPGCGLVQEGQTGGQLTSKAGLPQPFTVPLPIPAVAVPVSTTGGVDRYAITARVAQVEILPGLRTPILGYDGRFPGPTFESRSGRPVEVLHRNELPVPEVVHLHGGHTPPDSDGFPTDLVLPAAGWPGGHAGHGSGDIARGSRTYRYPMSQRAATLWYHDHRMDFTGPSVYRGLAGFHLIRDGVEDRLGLPSGDREIPLMICDRAFEADGSFSYPGIDLTMRALPGVQSAFMAGVLGDVVLVNGAPWPVHEVDAARYRLRILNASNARRYQLRLDPPPPSGSPFVQIGSDGGLLAQPNDRDTILTAPAERFDVVVDFGTYPVGTRVVLRNDLGVGSTAQVMQFVVARAATDDSRVPEVLSDVEDLAAAPVAIRRQFRFTRGNVGGHEGWTINGLPFDPDRMDAQPRLGDVERWQFVSDLHHPVHLHLDPFQVVRRGGGGPADSDAGWKDTVDVRPGEIVEVAVRFTDYAGRFVMHCHNLEHEDMMMMAAFATLPVAPT